MESLGEEHYRVARPGSRARLFVRLQRSKVATAGGRRAVLYVHGATFASALSIAYRFRGRSWRDALCDAGFDVWALDFQGFGSSDRYPEMDEPAEAHGPLCLADDAARQLETVVPFILEQSRLRSLSLVTHSWGSMPAGLFAGSHPTLIDRIVMFAPLARRIGPRYMPRPSGPAWRLVTVEDQWKRFVEDVPAHEPPVLSRQYFEDWAERYLDQDPESRSRHPAAVKTPNGPLIEILRAWHGELAWDPARVECPVAIVRGSWDGLVTDEDARWITDALSRAREHRDLKIARGTHLMHLEEMRFALWQETTAFLLGDDHRPQSPQPRGAQPMQDHAETKDLPGYNPGSPEVARSPISMDELRQLMASALFTDEDVVYLRLSYDVLKDQAEELVKMWRGIIALHPHLSEYSKDRTTGEADKEYGARVGKRFAQWVLDTARATYDQTWLDYQYEIGLRHHRLKKNLTDGAHTAPHIRGRDLIAFSAATVAPMRPYLEKGGHTRDVVDRMHQAWWKSMILQVALWSQPYINPGDF